ncbi:hypothetical protein D9M73_168170 [compost metagenome]
MVLCAHWWRMPLKPLRRRASATASRNTSEAPSPVQWAITRMPRRSMSTTMSVMCSGVRLSLPRQLSSPGQGLMRKDERGSTVPSKWNFTALALSRALR